MLEGGSARQQLGDEREVDRKEDKNCGIEGRGYCGPKAVEN